MTTNEEAFEIAKTWPQPERATRMAYIVLFDSWGLECATILERPDLRTDTETVYSLGESDPIEIVTRRILSLTYRDYSYAYAAYQQLFNLGYSPGIFVVSGMRYNLVINFREDDYQLFDNVRQLMLES